jgi:hypothetical protein
VNQDHKVYFLSIGSWYSPSAELLKRLNNLGTPVKPITAGEWRGGFIYDQMTGERGAAFYIERITVLSDDEADVDAVVRPGATDPECLDAYSIAGIEWGVKPEDASDPAEQQRKRDAWEATRKDFIRFYALRASVAYSLGSHDEWNIFVELNCRRAALLDKNGFADIGSLLAGWFDGQQIEPGAAVTRIVAGYST